MVDKNDKFVIPEFLIIMKWLENGGKCLMDLYNELGISYKHLVDLKKQFKKLGWIDIELEKKHNRHNIYLTEKGRNVLGAINNLLSIMEYDKNDIKEIVNNYKRSRNNNDDVENVNSMVDNNVTHNE